LQRLRAQGFAGGYSPVKASVRTVRPTRPPAFLTLAFAPGECAQADGGACGSVRVGHTSRRLRVFVMVRCYSRLMSVECSVSQTMEHCLACHQPALELFGGVPHRIMVDNRTSAVLTRALGEAPGFHPTYADCAKHPGCRIVPCNGGKGNEKGRVEHGVGSVQKNCLAGLERPDFRALPPAARHWLDTVAKVRGHGETRANPTDLGHHERPALGPLPLPPVAVATVSQVRASRQCRIPLETHRSAGPAHSAGHPLPLNTSPDRLCLSQEDTRIARHARRYERFQAIEAPDHPQPLLEQRKKARDHQVFLRCVALSPRAEASYRPREERRLNPHHHVRKIVALSDIYSPQAVARALDDAFVSEACSSDSIATLVAQRARCTPEASALPLPRSAALLELQLAQPDLSMSHPSPQQESPDPEEPASCRTPKPRTPS
jgi:transposase